MWVWSGFVVMRAALKLVLRIELIRWWPRFTYAFIHSQIISWVPAMCPCCTEVEWLTLETWSFPSRASQSWSSGVIDALQTKKWWIQWQNDWNDWKYSVDVFHSMKTFKMLNYILSNHLSAWQLSWN